MAKRRAAIENDESSSRKPTSVSKRARAEDVSDYEDAPRAKQSRKSHAAEEAEDVENDDESDDEDDSEAKNKIIKAFTEKRKQTGVCICFCMMRVKFANWVPRVLQSMVSLRGSSLLSLCVTNIWSLTLVLKSTSLLVCLFEFLRRCLYH